MGRIQLKVGCLAVALVPLLALPGTVDASIYRKYRLGSYEKAKEIKKPHGYRVHGTSVQGSQTSPGISSYRKNTSNTASKNSAPPISLTSLLSRLMQGSSSRSSVESERSPGKAEKLPPLLTWRSGDGLSPFQASIAGKTEEDRAKKTSGEYSKVSLASLIRNILDGLSASKSVHESTTGEGDKQMSPADTAEYRVREFIGRLLGRQSAGAGTTASPDVDHTRTNTSTAASHLVKVISQLLRRQNPSKITDEGKETTPDSMRSRPTFDLMDFVQRLMGGGKRPSGATETSGTKTKFVKIPSPMSTHAALTALGRWMRRHHRPSPSSQERLASIIMKLLSRMTSPKSSPSTTSSPLGILIKLLSGINKPVVSVTTSSTPTSTKKTPSGEPASTTPSSLSSSFARWLEDVEYLKASARASPAPLALAKWIQAIGKPTDLPQDKPSSTSPSPMNHWLGQVQRSRKESTGRLKTGSQESLSLLDLLSAILPTGEASVEWTARQV